MGNVGLHVENMKTSLFSVMIAALCGLVAIGVAQAADSPPAGAPNVLLVLLDDVGFGATSSFGGPINTPTIQKLSETVGHRCSQANSYLAGHIRQRTETVR